MYKVLLKASARKELDSFSEKIQKQIAKAIDELVALGIHAKNTKKLNPPIGGFRTRVGEYRILFDRDGDIILVYKISVRGDAY